MVSVSARFTGFSLIIAINCAVSEEGGDLAGNMGAFAEFELNFTQICIINHIWQRIIYQAGLKWGNVCNLTGVLSVMRFTSEYRSQRGQRASRVLKYAIVTAAGLALASCSSGKKDPFAGKGSPVYKGSGTPPKGGGRYHVGKTYSVAGVSFTPSEQPNYNKTGVASWYGPKFHRRMTANGEWFDMNYYSAAHATLPLPSYVKVTNLENNRQLIVRVNDRGPFVKSRIIDLASKSADALDIKRKGTARVRVTFIARAPLNDRGSNLAAMNAALKRGAGHSRLVATAQSGGGGGASTAVAALKRPHIPASANGKYYVQAGAYGERDNARRARNRLNPVGPVIITPVNGSYGKIYRVRVGPWSSPAQARKALALVVNAGHRDARVVGAE